MTDDEFQTQKEIIMSNVYEKYKILSNENKSLKIRAFCKVSSTTFAEAKADMISITEKDNGAKTIRKIRRTI